MKKSPIFIALISAALFGAATPASKALLATLPPFVLAGLLYIGAAIGVVPLLIRERKISRPWALDGKNRIRLMGAIGFGGLIGPVLLLFGLQLASSASVSLWLNLELIATILLGHFIFRDQMTAYGWIASGGTLLAAVLLSASEGGAGITAGVLVAAACFCWGMDNHLTALIDSITPSQSTFWKGLVAGTVNLAIGLITAEFKVSLALFAIAVIIGILSYGISIVLYINSAQRLGATRSQILFSSSPFFGVLLAAIFLGETISMAQYTAIAIIIFSLVFLFFEKHVHKHHHEPVEHDHWHHHDDGHHDHSIQHGLKKDTSHSHRHKHDPATHSHPHWPDLFHRHKHKK